MFALKFNLYRYNQAKLRELDKKKVADTISLEDEIWAVVRKNAAAKDNAAPAKDDAAKDSKDDVAAMGQNKNGHGQNANAPNAEGWALPPPYIPTPAERQANQERRQKALRVKQREEERWGCTS
jgi:hypothetical protein